MESLKIDNNKIESIARKVIKSIGYEQETFHWNKVEVNVNLHAQSTDIGRVLMQLKNQEEQEIKELCLVMPQ